jgi:hypothetical protein
MNLIFAHLEQLKISQSLFPTKYVNKVFFFSFEKAENENSHI